MVRICEHEEEVLEQRGVVCLEKCVGDRRVRFCKVVNHLEKD